ncbi:MAG: cysteine hydrolase [Synergistales bacterium]|nr:cysteine hydrolase [Synergistales bacterium]
MDEATMPVWHRAAMLTVDVQREFFRDGKRARPENEPLRAVLGLLVEAFRSAGLPVVHVVRLYLPDGSNADRCRRDALRRGEVYLEPGTEGVRLIEELQPRREVRLEEGLLLRGGVQRLGAKEFVVFKPRFGAFYRTPLEGLLGRLGVTTLAVCGSNYPNCPRTTLYEASERDFRIAAVTDGLSRMEEKDRRELAAIGVHPLRAQEIADALKGTAETV